MTRKKTRIRIGMVVIITCVMCFSDWSFAAEGNVGEIGSIARILNFIVSILSRIWVLFAKLAGEFLTNSWVYGEKLGIDVLLWQYRNIVKNIANFCLGFYLIYVIFKGLIGQFGEKGDMMKNLKNVLLRVLIAGIGVQASWFLTSAVVDLGTITLSAVGAFPSQVVSENEYTKEAIEISMRDYFGDDNSMSIVTGKIYELFPKDGAANSFTKTTKLSLNGTVSEEKFFDSLMPNDKDVAGPLYYLGFSILKVNEINSVSSWSDSSLKKSILNLIIQGGTTIVYSIEMGILCVIALMRIVYLWMFIVLSPLVILLSCIQKAGEKDLLGKGFIGDLMKQINLKTFLAKVFQPAIIVLGISLCTIFVTLINRIINNDQTRSMDKFDIGGATITTTQDPNKTNSDDITYTTKMEGNLLEFSVSHLGKGILDLMLSIITVILVYLIINASIKIGNSFGGGKDFLSKSIESITKGVTGVMTSLPIVPVAGYDKHGVPKTRYISAGNTFGLGKPSLIDKGIEKVQGKVTDTYYEQSQVIDSWFDNNQNQILKSTDKNTVIAASTGMGYDLLKSQFNKIVELGNRPESGGGLKSGHGYGMVLNPSASDKWWQERFQKWLTDMKDRGGEITGDNAEIWKNMVNRWNKDENSKEGLEAMFKGNDSKEHESVRAYAELFGLNLPGYTWDYLKDADFSKKA